MWTGRPSGMWPKRSRRTVPLSALGPRPSARRTVADEGGPRALRPARRGGRVRGGTRQAEPAEAVVGEERLARGVDDERVVAVHEELLPLVQVELRAAL